MDDYEGDATLSASEVEDIAKDADDELPLEDLLPCEQSQPSEYGAETLNEYIDRKTKMVKEKFFLINKVGKESH